jgi:RHS repeat-associated protein
VFYYSTNWQVIQEQVAGVTTQQYVWSPVYVDALIFRERDTDADGILDERLWAVQDANFNVVALTDDSGAAVERYQQTPFGVVTVLDASGTVLTASAYGWVYTHQGLRFDADAGLFDNRWRWYSPTLGRFVSVDPLGFAAGDINLFRVKSNQPTVLVDPSGLEPNKEPYQCQKPADTVAKEQAAWDKLTEEQKKATAEVITSGDRLMEILGSGRIKEPGKVYKYVITTDGKFVIIKDLGKAPHAYGPAAVGGKVGDPILAAGFITNQIDQATFSLRTGHYKCNDADSPKFENTKELVYRKLKELNVKYRWYDRSIVRDD